MTGENPLCIYCGKEVDLDAPHCFGMHWSNEPTPYWHVECKPTAIDGGME